MPIVSISLGDNQFEIACNESAKERLQHVADKLANELEKTKIQNPNAGFELLLVMTALKLQNTLDNLRDSKGSEILNAAHPSLHEELQDIEHKLSQMLQQQHNS